MADFEVSKQGNVTIFTLNRPEKLNSITPGMLFDMEREFMNFMEDPEARVGIVTGTGDKAFSSGVDVIEYLPFVKETRDKMWRMPKTPFRGLYVNKPLIAAVNGIAYGGGAEMTLACDIRVASENAKFRFPEPTIGLLPRLGGTQRLPRVVGYSKAMEIMLCGETITAEEALRIGLVSKVVPQDKLIETCLEMAANSCKLAPLAVQAIKRAIYEGFDKELDESLEVESRLGLPLYQTEDYVEGRNAFKEKRAPQFKGK